MRGRIYINVDDYISGDSDRAGCSPGPSHARHYWTPDDAGEYRTNVCKSGRKSLLPDDNS